MGVVTEREYPISNFDFGPNRRMNPLRVINIFQDLAMYQSEVLGCGLPYLHERKMGWVLIQWDVEISHLPKNMCVAKGKTESLSFRKCTAFRKLSMHDEEGNTYVKGMSKWALVDLENRALLNISDEFRDFYQTYESKLQPMVKMRFNALGDLRESYKLRYTDLDTNNHVNNAKYVEWAFNVVPREWYEEKTLKAMSIQYKKELRYPGTARLHAYEEGMTSYVTVVNDRDEVSCILSFTYEV